MSCTFDSNVLIYASGAGKADPRVDRARDIIARAMLGGAALLTLQVLGEFSNVAMRRYRLAVASVRVMTEDWSRAIPVYPADEADLAFALATVSRHRLQFWDAMLWATARRVGVRHLLTEDLQEPAQDERRVARVVDNQDPPRRQLGALRGRLRLANRGLRAGNQR